MKPIQIVMDYIPQRKAARDLSMLLFDILKEKGVEVTLIATGFENRGGRNFPLIREITGEITEDDIEFMNKSLWGPESDSTGSEEIRDTRLNDWNRKVYHDLSQKYLHRPDNITFFIAELNGHFSHDTRNIYSQDTLIYEDGRAPYLQCPIFNDKFDYHYESMEEILMPSKDSSPMLNENETWGRANELADFAISMAKSEMGVEQYLEIKNSLALNKA